jgi:acid phosphatase
MQRKLLCLSLVALSFLSAHSFAKEPINLAAAKQEVMRYHDSGEYEKDIALVIGRAHHYLKTRLAKPSFKGKPAIILDIDETSLSNYSNMIKLDFGGTPEEIRAEEDEGLDPAITPTLKLFQFAKDKQIAVIFITGRFEAERKSTIKNLEKAGYRGWDGLILRSKEYERAKASDYKNAARKQLAQEGYDIILNIGDQKSDLTGENTGRNFKLPNPFYFIP